MAFSNNPTAQVSHDRSVHVFISSTFRDMQAERDYLLKFVFPELSRRCRERGIELIEVDLRWGLTEDQAVHGNIFQTCLVFIIRCSPYSIGLLSERYGYGLTAINCKVRKICLG